jgi:hypothetical protein
MLLFSRGTCVSSTKLNSPIGTNNAYLHLGKTEVAGSITF